MKKFKPILVGLCVLTAVPTLAATTTPTTTTTQSMTKTEYTNKSVYMEKMLETKTLSAIHKATTLSKWYVDDVAYLQNTPATQVQLAKEIAELSHLLSLAKADFLMLNEIKIYTPSNVQYMDILTSSINMRTDIIHGDTVSYMAKGYYGAKCYDIISKVDDVASLSQVQRMTMEMILGDATQLHYAPTDKEINILAEGIYTALTTYQYPSNLTKNLKIYASPYYLNGYKGFTYTYSQVGREEEIVICNSFGDESPVQDVVDTVVHELGHVYSFDVLGTVVNPTKQYAVAAQLYTDLGFDVADIDESIPEHFRYYLQTKQNKKSNINNFEPNQKVLDFIGSSMLTYKPDTKLSMPTLKINGIPIDAYEFNDGINLMFNAKALTLTIGAPRETSKITFKLLKQDVLNNSAITILEEQPITTPRSISVTPGQYAVLIYDNGELLRFTEFGVIAN